MIDEKIISLRLNYFKKFDTLMRKFFRKIFDKFLDWLIFCLVHLLFRPKVYYVNKSRKKELFKEPTMIVSHHVAHYDGLTISSVFHKAPICHMAAKDRFAQKGLAFFFRHLNVIPIDRQQLDTSWIYQALDKLKRQKEMVAIYPEGLRSETGEILPFHSGITTIATLAQVPLVMIYIEGPYTWLIGNRVKLYVSEPFRLDQPLNGMNADYINEQTVKLHDKMVEMQNEFNNLK